MSGFDTESLLQLGETLAEAVVHSLGASAARTGAVAALLDYDAVTAHVAAGSVVADTSSADGLAGRGLVILSAAAAHALAHPATVEPPEPEPDLLGDDDAREAPGAPAASDETGAAGDVAEPAGAAADATGEAADAAPAPDVPAPGEAELSAVRALAGRIDIAIANALGLVLGQTIALGAPDVSVVDDPRYVVRPGAVQALLIGLTVGGIELAIIHFAPNALVVRAARAFEDLADDSRPLGDHGPSPETLSEINVRVWAELGRTRLALAEALELPLGAVVELDRDADAPVDLYVNGVSFGSGRLVVTHEGEWALAVDEIGPAAAREALAS